MNIHDITKGQTVVVPYLLKVRSNNIIPFEIEFKKLEVIEKDIETNEVTLIQTIGDRHGIVKVPADIVFFSKRDAIKEIKHELENYLYMLNRILEKEETP